MSRPSYLRRVAGQALPAAPALLPVRQAAPEDARPQVTTAPPVVRAPIGHDASAPEEHPAPEASAPSPSGHASAASSPPQSPPIAAPEAAETPPAPLVVPHGEPPSGAADNPPAEPARITVEPVALAPEATPGAAVARPSAEGAPRLDVMATAPTHLAAPAAPALAPEPPLARLVVGPEPASPSEPTALAPTVAQPAARPRSTRGAATPEVVAVDPPPAAFIPPAVRRSAPAPDAKAVEVRIGTIEIRAAAPPPVIPPAVVPQPGPAARPAPAFPRSYVWRYGIAQV